MTNNNYKAAYMLVPTQNKLLITQTDYNNYELLCKTFLTYGIKETIMCLSHGIKKPKNTANIVYINKVHMTSALIPWIYAKTPLLNLCDFDVRIPTRLYWIANGLDNFPKCQRLNCTNKIGLHKNVLSYTRGYSKHCCVACINKDQITRTKIKATNKYLYGNENYNNRAQNVETCIRKYGMKNGGGSPIAHQKMHRKYLYEDIYFDSAPEIALYMWLKDYGLEFEYQPKHPLQYKFEGHVYNYFVDFYVKDIDQLIEIKGDQFFNENGVLFCPFRKKSWTDEQYAKINRRYAMKHQCMIQNNVAIMKFKDYSFFLDYVSKTYGKDYLKQFRVNKPESK